jgi:protocatechuate 3,4-dioxygenase beta subunit
MNRRAFLATVPLAVAVLSAESRAFLPQDFEYLRAVERAQRDRPRPLTARGRIAPASEPGTPLVIRGRVFQSDGRSPAADVVVFAYHTDATGRYDVPSAGPHSWRLRGWTRTGADGRFELATIRPAPYPNRRTAAHVHLLLERPGVPRQHAGLMFTGDPLLTAEERRAAEKAGSFAEIRPVEVIDGVQHVALDIRLSAA